MTASDARWAVLTEYRLHRHAHRPYMAMRAIADEAAHAYMRAAVEGFTPEHWMQMQLLARFESADAYAREITKRDRHDVNGTHGYWADGGTHRGVTS